MYQKNVAKKKHVDLLLTGEEAKGNYVFIKDFNTFMYDHILHHGRKHFCRYFLQVFRTAEKVKCHIKDCCKINGKQRIKIPKKVNKLHSKIMKEKKSQNS